MIRFGRDVCDNLNEALRREWLETNGLGGFASSTIIGLNTRRYHGLLVAATKPPVGRYLLLSKLEETLLLDGRAFDLSTNRYPSVVHPQGFRYLKEFRLDPSLYLPTRSKASRSRRRSSWCTARTRRSFNINSETWAVPNPFPSRSRSNLGPSSPFAITTVQSTRTLL